MERLPVCVQPKNNVCDVGIDMMNFELGKAQIDSK